MYLDETWQVGLRPEKTKPCTFPAKSHYGFQTEHEKVDRRGIFLSCEPRTTSATFLGSISAKLPTNMCRGVARDTWFHIPEKFHSGIEFAETPSFLRCPICDQATGHRKCSVMPTLFPSRGGHPTDMPYLCDFC